MIKKKDYTILFYANGNNELAPEVKAMFVKVKNSCIAYKHIYIVFQIAQENAKMVQRMRPGIVNDIVTWLGVRRYAYRGQKMEWKEELGTINMATSQSLMDFIVWGITHYPAKKYILVMGGHTYQFVGLAPDYTQEKPYLLSFVEVAKAIDSAMQKVNAKLDALILDTCYANSFEIIYELGKQGNIEYLLTYIGNGPMEGLPYLELLHTLDTNSTQKTDSILMDYLHNPVVKQKNNVIIFRLHQKLVRLSKQLFHTIASLYLTYAKEQAITLTPTEIITTTNRNYPWFIYIEYITIISKLCIVDYHQQANATMLLYVLQQEILDMIRKERYTMLRFSKYNRWTAIVCGDTKISETTIQPLEMTRDMVTMFITSSNIQLTEQEIQVMITTIYAIKKWEF